MLAREEESFNMVVGSGRKEEPVIAGPGGCVFGVNCKLDSVKIVTVKVLKVECESDIFEASAVLVVDLLSLLVHLLDKDW